MQQVHFSDENVILRWNYRVDRSKYTIHTEEQNQRKYRKGSKHKRIFSAEEEEEEEWQK